jgi:ankyrin repeat protein
MKPSLRSFLLCALTLVCLLASTGCGTRRCRALHDAIEVGDLATTHSLLARKVSPECQIGVEGWTALHRAAVRGHTEALQALLSRGADLEARDDGYRTPLYAACREGQHDTARLLLERGARVDAQSGTWRFTALHVASERAHVEVVRLLLAHGATVDARNTLQQTPLHQAATYPADHDDTIAELLIAAGADTEAHDLVGFTPLIHAARANNARMVEALLAAGAAVNSTSDDGSTAVDHALQQGHTPLVGRLEQHGGRSSLQP